MCNNSLFSVRTDVNLQLNFAIFRPYGQKTAEFNAWFPSLWTEIKSWILLFSVHTNRWRQIIAQSSSTNQI